MVKNFSEIKLALEQNKIRLAEEYHVSSIGIFGSVVRGEQKESSDVDILVEFSKPISLFKFLELEETLTGLLGRKVDLVSKKSLKPNIGKNILREVCNI
ncbi:MAG: nucleotidyltransferase family protein [Brevinematales bacterium]|nr:nucleotidyltransferase family protein [Brevinematales bacterium]